MPREYSHIKEYEKAIPKLKEQVLVLSIVFRKNISAKMKFCAGKSGKGAAKPRLFAM